MVNNFVRFVCLLQARRGRNTRVNKTHTTAFVFSAIKSLDVFQRALIKLYNLCEYPDLSKYSASVS